MHHNPQARVSGLDPLATIHRHGIHFRPETPPCEAADIRIDRVDRVEIVGWEVFIHEGEPTSSFPPW
jgi:hypothetical protein